MGTLEQPSQSWLADLGLTFLFDAIVGYLRIGNYCEESLR